MVQSTQQFLARNLFRTDPLVFYVSSSSYLCRLIDSRLLSWCWTDNDILNSSIQLLVTEGPKFPCSQVVTRLRYFLVARMATETCPFAHSPQNADFELSESSIPSEIYEQFDVLRRTCPVAYTPQMGGYWMLTRYDDIKACASDTTTFISSVKAVIPSDPRGTRRPPLNTDPPVHTPYRTAIDRTLKPVRIKRLESVLQSHAQREWKTLVEQGGGDVSADFGANFAAWVEVTWLNLADESAPLLAKTAAAWVNAWREQNKDEVKFYSDKLYDMARALFKDRRHNPREVENDPASSLLAERVDGEPIPEGKLM